MREEDAAPAPPPARRPPDRTLAAVDALASAGAAHVYPVDAADLPPRRRKHGYDSLDFRFGEHGLRIDGGCAARVPLPGWSAARAATGQIGGGGALWRAEYRFPPAARGDHAARNSLQRASR